MAPEDDCMKEMFVIVGFAARKLGVPRGQSEPVKPDKATREAMLECRIWL